MVSVLAVPQAGQVIVEFGIMAASFSATAWSVDDRDGPSRRTHAEARYLRSRAPAAQLLSAEG